MISIAEKKCQFSRHIINIHGESRRKLNDIFRKDISRSFHIYRGVCKRLKRL